MNHRVVESLVLALLAAAPAFAADDAIVPARLNDVRNQPQTYLKTTFEFEGRFSNHGQIYQPFFTMFDDHLFTNFAAWDVDNDLAEYDEYRDSCALLYLNRHKGGQMEELFSLAKYQRFRATGIVQSIFSGRPFIEIIDIVPLDVEYTPEAHGRAALTQYCHEVARGASARPQDHAVAEVESVEPEELPATTAAPAAKDDEEQVAAGT